MPKSADNPARDRRALLTTAALGFLALGALASATGPTLPTLSARLHLTPTTAAWLLATFAAGSALGAATTGALRHTPPGPQLATAAALATTGSAALPLAPNLPTALTCLLLIGTGFGAADLVLNLTLATRRGGAATLTAVSATFGLGATATPLIAATDPTDPRTPHWTCAALTPALLAAATTLRSTGETHQTQEPRAPRRGTTTLLATTLLGYVALEGAATAAATRTRRQPPEGVQIILVNSQNAVLLQLRDDKPDIPHPNTWCIPGGHLDPGETPRQAATRELNEEMGLTIPTHHLHHITSTRRTYGYEHTYWTHLDVDPTTIDLTEGQRVQHFTAAQTTTMALGYEDNAVLAAFHATRLSTEPETAP